MGLPHVLLYEWIIQVVDIHLPIQNTTVLLSCHYPRLRKLELPPNGLQTDKNTQVTVTANKTNPFQLLQRDVNTGSAR